MFKCQQLYMCYNVKTPVMILLSVYLWFRYVPEILVLDRLNQACSCWCKCSTCFVSIIVNVNVLCDVLAIFKVSLDRVKNRVTLPSVFY